MSKRKAWKGAKYVNVICEHSVRGRAQALPPSVARTFAMEILETADDVEGIEIRRAGFDTEGQRDMWREGFHKLRAKLRTLRGKQ